MLFPFVWNKSCTDRQPKVRERLNRGQDGAGARKHEAASDTRFLTVYRYGDSVQTHKDILPLHVQWKCVIKEVCKRPELSAPCRCIELIQLNFHHFNDSKLTPKPETLSESNYLSLFSKGNRKEQEGRKRCVAIWSFILPNFRKCFPARRFGVGWSHVLSLLTVGRKKMFRVAKTDLPMVISEALWIKKRKEVFILSLTSCTTLKLVCQ